VAWEEFMQSRPQTASPVDFQKKSLDRSMVRSELAHKSRTLATLRRPGVLLVGKSEMWASLLCKVIEKVGAEIAFIPPLCATVGCILHGSYGVVLLDSCVPSEQRKNLARDLVGSPVSLFYVYPVEMGCWWLPAVRFGEDCHGSPGFRSREFLEELDRVLQGEPLATVRRSQGA
jgi:hypothetical protein